MPSSVVAGLGYLGAAVGAGAATSTAAIVVGGAIAGAVVGGAVSAIKGGNILKGVVVGGLIGAAAGGLGAWAAGAGAGAEAGALAGEAAAVGETAAGVGAGAAEGSAELAALEAASGGVSEIGGTAPFLSETGTLAVNQSLAPAVTSAAAKGGGGLLSTAAGDLTKVMAVKSGVDLIGGAAKGYGEAEAAETQREAQKERDAMILASRRATPVKTPSGPAFTITGSPSRTSTSKPAGSATTSRKAQDAATAKENPLIDASTSRVTLPSSSPDIPREREEASFAPSSADTAPLPNKPGVGVFTPASTTPDEQAMSYRNFFPANKIPGVTAQKGSRA